MSDPALLWLMIAVWLTLSGLVFLACTLIAARVFGATVLAVQWGTPIFFRVQVRQSELRIGLLPINVSTTFLSNDYIAEHPDQTITGKPLEELPLWRVVVLSLVPLYSAILLSLCCLPVPELLHQLAQAFPQVVYGALSPLETGREYLDRFVAVARESPQRAIGVLAAKQFMWLLMPFLVHPPGTAIHHVLNRWFPGSQPKSYGLGVALLLILPAFLPWIGWGVACVAYLWR